MELRSADFSANESVPKRFTCEGEDLSPSLEWSDLPEGAVELALTCEDPDAPGRGFVHWILWGIEPTRAGLPAGTVPDGANQGVNDFGSIGYRGPCPPRGRGAHNYRFTLYALREPLDLEEGASIEEFRGAVAGKVLAEATLVGVFER